MPTAVTENRSIPRRHEISVTKDKKRPQILSEQKGETKKIGNQNGNGPLQSNAETIEQCFQI